MDKKQMTIISLGGSLIVPDAIDWEFVTQFKTVIEKYIKKGKRFIIITGGGKTARRYIEAAAKVVFIDDEDKDWLGIHATRMNAHFIRTIFKEHAHPRINKNPNDVDKFKDFKESILVAAGWRPGCSTDYDAVLLAKCFNSKRIVNLSNIDFVYDKDPNKFADAHRIERISWRDFRKMVGDTWKPGMNAPFDPIASKIAEELALEVVIMNGNKLDNLAAYVEDKEFKGTVIK